MKNLTFLVLLSLLSFNSCIKSDCNRRYTFEFPASLYPALDTFSIGDSIWYEMNIDKQIMDVVIGELVDITALEINFNMRIARYDTIHYTRANLDFNYHVVQGEQYFSANTTSNLFFEANKDKAIKLCLIPKKPGGFALGTSIENDIFDDEINLNDDCTEYLNKDSKVIINDNVDNNVEILNGLYFINNSGDTLPGLAPGIQPQDVTNTYVFYVR